METKNILIVEDDADINQILDTALKKAGYSTTQAYSGTEARMLLKLDADKTEPSQKFACVLLDLMLPGISGETVLEDIRKMGNLPVIVITAKDELGEKINLLTSGADDYIIKPFQIEEVIARIQVQLRHASKEPEADRITYRKMVLDRTSRRVTIEGKVLEDITKQEFSILELLMKHPRQVFGKEDIFEYAWDEPYVGETKTLDVHISNIRKKIKAVTDDKYIETVWGIGYRMYS